MTDVILFGALSNRCNQCNQCNARPIFKNFLYRCNGFGQYAQCNRIVENPERRIAVIPESLRNKYPFIEKYRGIRTRWLNLDPETEQQLIHMQTIAESVINNNNSSEVFKTETLKSKFLFTMIFPSFFCLMFFFLDSQNGQYNRWKCHRS